MALGNAKILYGSEKFKFFGTCDSNIGPANQSMLM